MNTHAFLFEKFTHILISTNCFLMRKMSNALHKSTNFYKIYLQFLNNLPISSPGTCPNIDQDRDFKSECTHGAGACNTNYYCIMYQIHQFLCQHLCNYSSTESPERERAADRYSPIKQEAESSLSNVQRRLFIVECCQFYGKKHA